MELKVARQVVNGRGAKGTLSLHRRHQAHIPVSNGPGTVAEGVETRGYPAISVRRQIEAFDWVGLPLADGARNLGARCDGWLPPASTRTSRAADDDAN
jgi:hypothetical protein